MGGTVMKTNAPKTVTWIISVVLIVIGLIGKLTNTGIDFIQGGNAFWWTFAGGLLSVLAAVLKGL